MNDLRAHLRRLGPAWTHWTPLALILWPLYVLFVRHEVRWEFATLVVVVLSLAFIGPRTRRLYIGLYPLGLVAVIYDAMRFIQNFGISPDNIHVCDLRNHELALFGIGSGDARLTLQDYFLVHKSDFADLYCAIPYGTFIFVSIVFAIFLYRGSFLGLQRYTWTFLFLNLAGFVTYHVYPAAPPWYYHLTHNCIADLSTHASEATHLANVDRLLGIPYFKGFYGRSADVFGSVPSLHVAYPLLILIEGWPLFGPIRRALAILFAASMCFAAVYLDHHYVIDVLLGLSYTVIIHLTFRAIFARLEKAHPKPSVPSTEPATG